MRKAVYRLLTTDAPLLALLPADRWLARGAVPDVPEKPFAVLAWQGQTPVNGVSRLPRLTLWVYQERGSYDLIDDVLRRATEVLTGVQQFVWEGERIAQVDYEGDSVDLYDDVYRANAKNAGYRVIGSGL